MATEVLMPALSPTMEEGTLAKWLVKEGDTVKSGQILAEIETDKATMEFEAVDEGVIGKLLVAEGTANVKVNTPIAVMVEDGESVSSASSSAAGGSSVVAAPVAAAPVAAVAAPPVAAPVAVVSKASPDWARKHENDEPQRVAAKMLQAFSELTRIRAMVDRAQFLEALSDLAQLVARDPRNSKVWLHIGFVYVRMSIWPQAMEALQMALEIEPRMPNAQRLLALALFSTGRRQEACDLIDDEDVEPTWLETLADAPRPGPVRPGTKRVRAMPKFFCQVKSAMRSRS